MTAQVPEILLWRGRKLALCDEPLRPYLMRLRKSRRPSFAAPSTALWRGYVGSWTIENDVLRLRDIKGWLKVGDTIVDATMALAFPWLDGPKLDGQGLDGYALDATWVSGVLRCPEGRLLSYAHQAFMSQYERDRFLTFEHGRLIQEHLVLNPPEPIIYSIAPDGSRTCVPTMRLGEQEILEDPLAGHDVSDAHVAWGRPLEGDAEDEDYVLGGCYTLLS